MFNPPPFGEALNHKIMELEEKIEILAKEYVEQYEPRFRKAAQKAYMDGMLKVLDMIKEKCNGKHN